MKRHFLISALSVLLISACGSGGGGSENPNPVNPSPETPKETISSEGKNYIANVNFTYLSQNPIQFNNSDKLSQITVEGKTFDLVEVSKDGISQSGWLRVIGGNIQTGRDNLPDQISKVSVYSSDNLVVGLLSSNISKWHEYAFINGKYTDVHDMPKGSATYSILVPMFSHTKHTVSDYSTRGKLNVNFDNKTVNGAIEVSNREENNNTPETLQLNAKINGSSFASEEQDPVILKGGFFGPNANEIGGIFRTKEVNNNKSPHIGAFAGKKD